MCVFRKCVSNARMVLTLHVIHLKQKLNISSSMSRLGDNDTIDPVLIIMGLVSKCSANDASPRVLVVWLWLNRRNSFEHCKSESSIVSKGNVNICSVVWVELELDDLLNKCSRLARSTLSTCNSRLHRSLGIFCRLNLCVYLENVYQMLEWFWHCMSSIWSKS